MLTYDHTFPAKYTQQDAYAGITPVFQFYREGSFRALAEGPYHCSPLNYPEIRYFVFIECSGLDQRGFLFDQLNIRAYFNDIQRTDLSCELLAHKCCQDIRRLATCENNNLMVHSVTVTLQPEGPAGEFGACITSRL